MSPDAAAPPASPKGGNWAKAHKTELIVGGGALVAAWAYYRSKHPASSATAAGSAAATSAGSSTVPGTTGSLPSVLVYEPAGTPTPSSPYPNYGAQNSTLLTIEEEIAQLSQEVTALQDAQPVNTTTGGTGTGTPTTGPAGTPEPISNPPGATSGLGPGGIYMPPGENPVNGKPGAPVTI